MAADKDAITCHVLDTSIGKPARGVRVKLEGPGVSGSGRDSSSGGGGHHSHAPAAPKTFESQTDDDGRVNAWLPYSSEHASGDVPTYSLDDVLSSADESASSSGSTWTLRFYTGDYFGGEDKTFFPEVVVTFSVRKGEHYHVPLLLAPYSYSTYRGS